MAFYIRPPHGTIQLAKLESMVWCRLKFLIQVSKASHSVVSMKDLIQEMGSTADSDCLIEASQKDAVSHFILRLLCAQDREMAEFFTQTETRLFSYRFSCMTYTELCVCVKPLRQLVRRARGHQALSTVYRDVLEIVQGLTAVYSWTMLIENFVNLDSGACVQLPFIYVLELVRRRTVTLDRGMAQVPCSKLCDVLTTVFHKILTHGILLAEHVLPSVVETDTRLAKLLKSTKAYFRRQYSPYHVPYGSVLSPIRHEDIDVMSVMFPPCMATLHTELRHKHRLPHHSRIAYTLFLKELGLPVHEALQFWQTEYSRPPSQHASHQHGCQVTQHASHQHGCQVTQHASHQHGCQVTQHASHQHGCQHTWQRDGKRYVYSIRHLYGLEGARVNYRGHCCTSIQNRTLSGMEAGGCPFKHFDKQHLIQGLSLADLNLDYVRLVLKLANQDGCYNQACQVYLSGKLEQAHRTREKLTSSGDKTHEQSRLKPLENSDRTVLDRSTVAYGTKGPTEEQLYLSDNLMQKMGQDVQTLPVKEAQEQLNRSSLHFNNAESHSKLNGHRASKNRPHFSSQFQQEDTIVNGIGRMSNPVVYHLNLTQTVCRESSKCNRNNEHSCYDHEHCPDSQDNGPLDTLTDVSFTKPIEYFLTCKSLLQDVNKL